MLHQVKMETFVNATLDSKLFQGLKLTLCSKYMYEWTPGVHPLCVGFLSYETLWTTVAIL